MPNKLNLAKHSSLNFQQAVMTELLMENPVIPPVLDSIKNIPQAWIGAGILFQNIWNKLHDFPVNTHIKDIDILYWDRNNLTKESEAEHEKTCRTELSGIELAIDVKNIARVHLWYEQRFGIPRKPYCSVEESISTWPVIGACMAVRLNRNNIEFCTPYGFQDALCMRVRPNKVLVNRDIYQAKAKKWKQQWPMLSVEEW